ncbi:MAG: citryl-CoA lyase [Anaerolineae bacterium]|nr:citryl-CoA lyase [Anaerolineae bacterium]
MSEETWKTAITKIEPNKIAYKGYLVEELMGRVPFADVVFLLLKGELPSKEQGLLMDAMLVSSVDHGATPPSALAARTVASGGAALTASVAAGITSINKHHGGAIEGCMRVLLDAVGRKRASGEDAATVAARIVAEYKEAKKRFPGYGHRVHTQDPRSVRLFALAEELGLAGEYVEMAHALRLAIKEHMGRDLPMNVDGAIATMLCEMEFPPEMSNGIFAISRSAGLVAQVYEEQTRMRPMRRIDPSAHEYDGPPERKLG